MKTAKTMIREWEKTHPLNFFQTFTYVRPRKNGEATVEVWGACRHKRRKTNDLVMKKFYVFKTERKTHYHRDILIVDNWSTVAGGPHIAYDKRFCGGRDVFHYVWNQVGGEWEDVRGKWLLATNDQLLPNYGVMLNGFENTRYKYCAYTTRGGMSVMDYLALWKEFPQIEIFSKMGCYRLFDRDFLAKCRDDKEFAKFVFKNRTFISEHSMSPSAIRGAFRRHMNCCDYEKWKIDSYMERIARIEAEKERKRLATDKAYARAVRLEKKRILALYEKLKSICGQYGAYEVIVPKTKEEMIAEGNAMHNCIGHMYASRQGRDAICLFLHKDGKPFVDIEISPMNYSVIQVRLVCNENAGSVEWEIARKLAERIRNIRKPRKTRKAA